MSIFPSAEVVVLSIIQALQRERSWCGETHIQKTAYFVSRLHTDSLEYFFILYKHGPFSFELHEELDVMRARSLLSLEATFPYGSRFRLTERGETRLLASEAATQRTHPAISFAAAKLAPYGVATLERLATALFFTSNSAAVDRVARIVDAKPHISRQQANAAIVEVDRVLSEWRQSSSGKKKAA